MLWCDNVAATYLTKNPVFHSRSKDLEIDFHFVQDLVAKRELDVCHISTYQQLVDALIKPLHPAPFITSREKLHVVDSTKLEGGY